MATATTAASVSVLDAEKLRHEHFCLPRPDEVAARIEGFVAYTEDKAGRSQPSKFVTRCQECGAANYRPYTPREIR